MGTEGRRDGPLPDNGEVRGAALEVMDFMCVFQHQWHLADPTFFCTNFSPSVQASPEHRRIQNLMRDSYISVYLEPIKPNKTVPCSFRAFFKACKNPGSIELFSDEFLMGKSGGSSGTFGRRNPGRCTMSVSSIDWEALAKYFS